MNFRFTMSPINTESARRELLTLSAGGYVSFEGWVRDLNEGQEVTRLEYEAFQELAVKEGERIIGEAMRRFAVKHALCIHRVGSLDLSDMAVWVGVSSVHRGEAFDACRFIIDEVKHRVPIWKKEHYRSGDSGWVNCERCAAAPLHSRVEDSLVERSHVEDLRVENSRAEDSPVEHSHAEHHHDRAALANPK